MDYRACLLAVATDFAAARDISLARVWTLGPERREGPSTGSGTGRASTVNLPRTSIAIARYSYRVDIQTLIDRIEERLKALTLSERKACVKAGINIHTIQNIKKGHIPAADKLAALARALEVPSSSYLTGETESDAPENPGTGDQVAPFMPLSVDYIVGEVRAGAWLEAAEWRESDRMPISVPIDPAYERLPRFGVIVRGPSMNELYPEGTVLICVRLMDLGREPEDGERVVVFRTRPDGLVEATAKEYRLINGRAELHPRSTDPRYQAPTPLLDGTRDQEGIEITIHAVVIGSYRPEKPLSRRSR